MTLSVEQVIALCGQALALGQFSKAEELATAVLDHVEENADLRGIVGAACLEQGRLEDALHAYSMAIKWGGASDERLYALGLVYQRMGKLHKAASSWMRALECNPDHVEAAQNAVQALFQLEQWGEAIRLITRIVENSGESAQTCMWLGHAQAKCQNIEASILAYEQAVSHQNSDAQLWFLLALAYRDVCRFQDARHALMQVMHLASDHVEARFELAQLELMAEHWESGFKLWESRLQRRVRLMPDDLPGSLWTGDKAPDATLLIQAEQGFGDTLQFARYARHAIANVGQVIFRVHPKLVRLFQASGLDWIVVPFEHPVEADFHVPLLSLPHVMECYDPLLAQSTYLSSIRTKQSGRVRKPPSVAIVWAGNPDHHNDYRRSSTFKAFSALAAIPGVDFVHFQFDETDFDARAWSSLRSGCDGVRDFCDTAHKISNFDLIISVDTAFAHLSAALGHTTWVVVPNVPDWRWGETGEQSPWYTTVRVWRQPRPGDWDGVMQQICCALPDNLGHL